MAWQLMTSDLAEASDGEGPFEIYLPALLQPAPPEPCADPAGQLARCPGSDGWRPVCGGFGQVAGLHALEDAEGRVMAVGDGIAQYRESADGRATWDVQLSPRRDGAAEWNPEGSSAHVGLRAIELHGEGAAQVGWAAGDNSQIVAYRDGCWQRSRYEADEDVTYNALEVWRLPDRPGEAFFGIAVGEAIDRGNPFSGERFAAVAELTGQDLQGWVEWPDQYGAELQEGGSAVVLPPALNDVSVQPIVDISGGPRRGPNGGLLYDVWAVGGDAAEQSGAFLLVSRESAPSASPGVERHFENMIRTPGMLPLGLVFPYPNGYTFGDLLTGLDEDPISGESEPGLAGWRYAGEAEPWRFEPSLSRPGQRYGAKYFAALEETGRGDPTDDPAFWLAMPPLEAGGSHRLDWLQHDDVRNRRSFTTTLIAEPDVLPGAAAPRSAVAPILRDLGQTRMEVPGILYAHGDEVWRLEPERGDWRRVRQRIDIAHFLPRGQGGLALSPGAGTRSSRLLAYDGQALRSLPLLDERLSTLPHMLALAGDARSAWLGGEEGMLLHLAGQTLGLSKLALPAQMDPLDPSLPLRSVITDLSAPEGDTLWAVSHRQEGFNAAQLWVMDKASGAWQPLLDPLLDTRLLAVDALPSGHAFAVGEGAAVSVVPHCDIPTSSVTFDCQCRAGRGVCSFTSADYDFQDVVITNPDQAWAVGAYNYQDSDESAGKLLRLRHPGANMINQPKQPSTKAPQYLRYETLAAVDERSLWVVEHCGRNLWKQILPEDIEGEDYERGRFRIEKGCGEDAPFFSRVYRFHFDNPEVCAALGEPGKSQCWEPPTELNVPIRDVAVSRPATGGPPRSFLAGDWTTLIQRD